MATILDSPRMTHYSTETDRRPLSTEQIVKIIDHKRNNHITLNLKKENHYEKTNYIINDDGITDFF
jgi:hypothetical protein